MTIADFYHDRLNLELLGISQLTEKEQGEMVKYYHSNEADIFVICESCENALYHHPIYRELDYFIH